MGVPIFEIILLDRHIKIYVNGHIEGCDGLDGRLISRIGLAVRPDLWDYFSKSQETDPSVEPYSNCIPSAFAGLGQEIALNSGSSISEIDAATGDK
jgi:hypothetical protein